MKIDLPDDDHDVIIKIRNLQLISKIFLSEEHIDYALRCLVERNIKRLEDKCD